MKFSDATVALGIWSVDGETNIIEMRHASDARGRTLDQVIFLREENSVEWVHTVYCATRHSKLPNPITRLRNYPKMTFV